MKLNTTKKIKYSKTKTSFRFQKFNILLLMACVLMISCNKDDTATTEMKPAIVETVTDISNVTVTLPEATGKELVTTNCIICHSLRYIEMQPDFPKKTWDKTVKKMVKTYGAPISDTMVVNQIVDYLVAVKGKK